MYDHKLMNISMLPFAFTPPLHYKTGLQTLIKLLLTHITENTKTVSLVLIILSYSCLKSAAQVVTKDYIETGFIDKTINPADDFYKYANGNWLKQTKIPGDGYVMTMTTLLGENSTNFEKLLESILKNPERGSFVQMQLSNFYKSGLTIEKNQVKVIQTIKKELYRIDNIKSKFELQQYLVEQNTLLNHPIIKLRGNPYDEYSKIVKAEFKQSGIMLPKQYYTGLSDENTLIIQKYKELLHAAYTTTGVKNISLDSVISFEKKLAEQHDTATVLKSYSISQLGKNFPAINWVLFQQAYHIPDTTTYYLQNINYFLLISNLIKNAPLSVWKMKLKSDYILFHTKRINAALNKQYNTLFEELIYKNATPNTINEEVQSVFNNYYQEVTLADVTGNLFAKTVFSEADRQRLLGITKNIIDAFRKRITSNSWLSPESKKEAEKKLTGIVLKIGYPAKVENESLIFSADNYIDNYNKLLTAIKRSDLNQIGKAKLRNTWTRNQWSIAGSYIAESNSIEIVSGLLQYPFYQRGADDAVLYGTFGSIIAHEIVHAFDNNGKGYDESGVKRNWMTARDTNSFNELVNPLISQFSDYIVLDSVHLDGNLSLGENIADLVGLQIAFDAFTQTKQYKGNIKVNNIHSAERFMLAFAQQWRSIYTDEILKEYFLSDVHPPDNIRVNGVMTNFDFFQQFYKVQPGNKLYNKKRLVIW